MKKKFLFYFISAITSVLIINSLLLYALFKSSLISLHVQNISEILNKVSYMSFIINIFLIVYSLFFVYFIIDKVFLPIYKKNYDISMIKEKSIKELLPVELSILEQYNYAETQKEKYKKEKHQIELIMQNMSEGLVIINTMQKIIYLNSNAITLLDAKDQDYKNDIFLALSRNEHYVSAVKTSLEGEKYTDIVNIKDKNIQILSGPVYYKDEIIAIFLLISDKTEEYKRDKHKREFTANVSHELKTPLTSILGYADLISQGFATGEDIKIFANKISQNSYTLLAMINDIIKLSKIEDSEKIEKTNIDFSNLLLSSIENLKVQCKDKNIKMKHNIPKDIILYGNENMLLELITNLINNAIKYNKENGKIEINLSQEKSLITLEVKDTGIGIPKKNQDRVFERFYTVDKSHSKKNGGTGLGLSIVKHIALQHNAKIYLESEVDKGSTFKVVFDNKIKK